MRETEGEPTSLAVEATPSLDLIFEILSVHRRRYALYYLHDQSDSVATVAELIDNVSALDQLQGETDLDPEERRNQIKTELQHVHLPKLEDAGLIEYDLRSETVRYWHQPSLEEWLEHAKHKELSGTR
ncbi:DUF7344 domain-containing protein [Halosolutus gelatinilyticus]|uniref:DUF7344 domain-containing protein n=1 Tax=Halosolutus gelatinilyticus TaxID=2931975 RepID=UPI001FF2B9FF|nr:hypothetical protein [Halosolutus gelatinilyticus]